MNLAHAAPRARTIADRRIVVFLALVLLGATLLRAPGILRRLDEPSWRPIDTAAIARNFYEEGLSPLHPRIDWRGDGPGYTEMELPLQPFLMALAYELVGPHTVIGRLLALAASVATLVIFAALARRRLGTSGAMVAFALFAVNPLAVELATELQPEAFMLLGIVGAVMAFDRFVASGRLRHAILAAALFGFAVLVKAPAAHLLLGYAFFVGLGLVTSNGAVARRHLAGPRAVLLVALASVPAVAWYVHAHRLWLRYGNSMGISNESHLFGVEILRHPEVALAVVKTSAAHGVGLGVVLLGLGALLVAVRDRAGPAAAAAAAGRIVARRALELSWLGAALVYLIVIGRTAGDAWARYYHVVAVPPAALLGGAAAGAILRRSIGRRRLIAGAVWAVALGQIAAWGWAALAEVRPGEPDALYRHARNLRSALPPGPIVVVGGPCRDAWGGHVAYQAPYFFYWMDRKGWSICREEVTRERVAEFAARGARVLVAEHNELESADARVEARLRRFFPVLAESPRVTLFSIAPTWSRSLKAYPP